MRIALIGGSGFIGQALHDVLVERDYEVAIVSRRVPRSQAERKLDWRIYQPQQLSDTSLGDCECVINLAGILNTRIHYSEDFFMVHFGLVARAIEACREAGIQRYIQLSALNASPEGPSEYLKTKYEGENLAVHDSGLKATSFRPSVVFGPHDSFLNRFAKLLKWLPLPIFPLACADTRFAPVYVQELAQQIADSIADEQTIGRHINVCGPKQYTLADIVRYVAQLLGRRVKVVPLSDGLSKFQAHICDYVPGRPFSYDNYLSLQRDSICEEGTPLCSVPMEDIAPQYIGRGKSLKK